MQRGNYIDFEEQKERKILKLQGYAQDFESAGVYGIYIDDILVYIGKSRDMLSRLAQHSADIKHRGKEHRNLILREAREQGHKITPKVLYKAKSKSREWIDAEIGKKEGELIRKHMPPLNTQIPKEEDWRRYTINPAAQKITLEEILRKETV